MEIRMPKGTCTCTPGCMNCWNNCATFGECLKNKNVRVVSPNFDTSREKSWDRELDLYRSARAQGIQPASTKTADIRKAIEVSNKTGVAFDASN